MKSIGVLCIILVAFVVLPLDAGAGELAGQETIAEKRRTLTPGNWIWYAAGLATGINAFGAVCTHPASVGELAAYLQHTAHESKTVTQAVKDDLARRGCRIGEGTEAKAAWFDPLVAIRTSVDEGYLRTVVQAGGEGEVAGFMRMLAIDRLRELGQLPKGLRPTQ